MNTADAIDHLGEAARPFSTIFLAICLGLSLFFSHVDSAIAIAVGGAFGALIGARAWENNTKVKAAQETTKTVEAREASPAVTKITTTEKTTPAKGKK